VRLAADLWPKWTVTKSIAETMAEKFGELDADCVERALRDHRMARSTVPDLSVIMSAAKSRQDAKSAAQAYQFRQEAFQPRQQDLDRARHELGAMDEEKRLWLWRYCRNMARLEHPWETISQWPGHWTNPAPPMIDWPEEVLGVFHRVHATLAG